MLDIRPSMGGHRSEKGRVDLRNESREVGRDPVRKSCGHPFVVVLRRPTLRLCLPRRRRKYDMSVVAHHPADGSLFISCSCACAARSLLSIEPPAIVSRLSDMRCTPLPASGARLELSVREFTPIHEISDDSRPYSIFGQRFITTLRPEASAFAAAASSRTVSCIQITCG